jgi:DNA replication and repair protein RecF
VTTETIETIERESRSETTENRIQLASISIRDFRNLERVDLHLPADGVAIIGDNGHGKTNLLEAIYYLQILRSIRDARDQDLTRFDASGFHISAKVYEPHEHDIGVGFERVTKRKKVTIDGVQPRRLSDALGSLPSVMFSPRDLELVRVDPC